MQTRRSFIRNVGLAIPAMSIAEIFLASCSKTPKPGESRKKICIIGAGISGLQAALLLQESNQYDIEILEASDNIGGRISSVNAFNTGHVETGSSVIYGSNNAWYNLVKKYNPKALVANPVSTFIIDGTLKTSAALSSDSDYQLMLQKYLSLSQYNAAPDMSIDKYMQVSGVPERVKFIFREKAETCIGTSIDRASLMVNKLEGLEKATEKQYTSGAISFSEIIQRHYAPVLTKVLNNTAVTEIDYSNPKIKVTDSHNAARYYDKVIVTVPLSILKLKNNQAYSMKFIPELPAEKRAAMDQLGMDGGVRILLKVRNRFWQPETKTIYSEGKYGRFDIVSEDLISNTFVLSATIHGKFAEEQLNTKNEAEIIEDIKKEWLTSIGISASESIIDSKVEFWAKKPYIQGAFSYHKVGGGMENREILSKPVNNRIFFAGEACNYNGKSGTVNGAMDTANKVVEDLIHAL